MISPDSNVGRGISALLVYSMILLAVPVNGMVAEAERAKADRLIRASTPKPAMIASRDLSESEMETMRGKAGENPYMAGSSKVSVDFHGIDLSSGNFGTSATDLSFEGGYGIPINVTRSYSANNSDEGPLGKGWTLSVDIRNTAGGLLKSASSPVRSVPNVFRERPSAQSDPNIPVSVQPVNAVVSQDAGGRESTVQRDVDGVLTTPAWDKNVISTEYEYRDGAQIMVSNTVETPEGTVYVYEKLGYYLNGGAKPWNDSQATPEPSNVLKPVSVTDRHGNQTTYTYDSSENNWVQFVKSNGTAKEARLLSIEMPNGLEIGFTWSSNRIVSTTDGTRTVSYQYTNGLLTGVGTPASEALGSPGKYTTTYAYGSATGYNSQSQQATNLLTSITDPRGMVRQIAYKMAEARTGPYATVVEGVVAWRVIEPNGHYAYFEPTLTVADPPSPSPVYGQTGGFELRIGGPSGELIDEGDYVFGFSTTSTPRFFAAMIRFSAPDPPVPYAFVRHLSFPTQDLTKEIVYTPLYEHGLGGRGFTYPTGGASGNQTHIVETATSYNFMGNPLAKTVSEFPTVAAYSGSPSQTMSVQYAYWGKDKYFQQKATRQKTGSSSWRYSYTDYYSNTAATGKKGQTYRVWDDKRADFIFEEDATWRYDVVPDDYDTHSAQFDYDSKGRPIDVWKIQKTTTNPWTYVRTHTEYGADQSPWWGMATDVTEDYGGINRVTETLEYDTAGRAISVLDAAGRQWDTTYDLDGKVLDVWRMDAPHELEVVAYEYGTTPGEVEYGMVTSVLDGIYTTEQEIAYHDDPGEGWHGQVASVEESRHETSVHTASYTYWDAGDRKDATHVTPNGTSKWRYKDYVSVGTPGSMSRVFQTMVRLNSGGSETSEQFFYAFDCSGRLKHATFAMTPQNGYTDYSVPAASRGRATYNYDAGGRLSGLVQEWETWGGSSYSAQPLLKTESTYSGYLALKTETKQFANNGSGAWVQEREEDYGYDADLDYLTSTTYAEGGSPVTQTWTYDAAGNRASDSLNTGSWAYDNLNRMTASPLRVYENDVLGNRTWTNRTSQTLAVKYNWDVLNRMSATANISTGGARYEYRADGMRVLKVEGLSLVWVEEAESEEEEQEEGSGYWDEYWASNKPTTRYYYEGQMGIEEDFTRKVSGQDQTDVIRHGLGAQGIDFIGADAYNASPSEGRIRLL